MKSGGTVQPYRLTLTRTFCLVLKQDHVLGLCDTPRLPTSRDSVNRYMVSAVALTACDIPLVDCASIAPELRLGDVDHDTSGLSERCVSIRLRHASSYRRHILRVKVFQGLLHH